jgi:hypothetical protein
VRALPLQDGPERLRAPVQQWLLVRVRQQPQARQLRRHAKIQACPPPERPRETERAVQQADWLELQQPFYRLRKMPSAFHRRTSPEVPRVQFSLTAAALPGRPHTDHNKNPISGRIVHVHGLVELFFHTSQNLIFVHGLQIRLFRRHGVFLNQFHQ